MTQLLFAHTQLFGACQQALLVRENIVEDKKLGSDRVALSSSTAAALPLLVCNKQSKTKTNYTSWVK